MQKNQYLISVIFPCKIYWDKYKRSCDYQSQDLKTFLSFAEDLKRVLHYHFLSSYFFPFIASKIGTAIPIANVDKKAANSVA